MRLLYMSRHIASGPKHAARSEQVHGRYASPSVRTPECPDLQPHSSKSEMDHQFEWNPAIDLGWTLIGR